MPFGNSLYHVETSQLFCKVNWLTGLYMVRVISLECIFDQTVVLLLLKVDTNYHIFMNITMYLIICRIVSANYQL